MLYRCNLRAKTMMLVASILCCVPIPALYAADASSPFGDLDIPGVTSIVEITLETPTAEGTERPPAPFDSGVEAVKGQADTVAADKQTSAAAPAADSAAVGTTSAQTQAPSAQAPAATSRYTVVPGDCLWNIAKRFLGDGSRYWEIVELNKDRYPSIAKNPDLIYPGWEFIIPGSTGQTTKKTTASTVPVVPATNVTPPSAGASGGKALLGWLQAAGLSGENLRMAWSIAMAESGGNPRAFNGNTRTGDQSYGLFQINMLGSMGPARRKQFGISSNEQLFDPMTNIRAMLMVSNNCQNWRPWSVYTRGSYTRYYSAFPPR